MAHPPVRKESDSSQPNAKCLIHLCHRPSFSTMKLLSTLASALLFAGAASSVDFDFFDFEGWYEGGFLSVAADPRPAGSRPGLNMLLKCEEGDGSTATAAIWSFVAHLGSPSAPTPVPREPSSQERSPRTNSMPTRELPSSGYSRSFAMAWK